MLSRVDESQPRHPLEAPLFIAFVVLNFSVMAGALFIVAEGSEWIERHPVLSKYSGRIRAVAMAAVLGLPAIAFARNTRRANIIGNSIRVSEHQFPEIHRILLGHCAQLGIDPPELYVSDCAIKEPARAYMSWRQQYIVLGSSFVQPDLALMRETISFLLGRELGRLRLGHASWFTDLLLAYVNKIPYLSNPLLRVFTYSEDRYGALLEPASLLGLVSIASGRRIFEAVNIDRYVEQARAFRGFWGRLSVFSGDKPPVAYRIQALIEAGASFERAGAYGCRKQQSV